MLSTEYPPPADPSLSSSATSQLKSGSCNIGRAFDDGSRQQQQLEELDLTKYDNNSLPNFSIRDYVFNARGKDIEKHWPFSPKNLQLCLQHGVKDILPPFDSVIRSSTVQTINNSDVEEFGDHRLCFSSNNVGRKLALEIDNIEASGSQDDKDRENPLPSTSRSIFGVNSVPTIKSLYLEQSSSENPGTSVISASDKVGINSQNSGKKCRLLVKLSSVEELKPNRESSVGTSVVSETMASQMCPVCKTFSSPSNTTLNAHIDQCLSRESIVKCTANLKVAKHNTKPRKTKLMSDIYAAALHITLEDLDRRNGTNWALNADLFPVGDTKVCPEEKSRVSSSEKNDEGAVYFDSKGKKLRILSKSGDQQSDDDFGPQKLVRTDRGSKGLLIKKKKHPVHRHELSSVCDKMKSADFGIGYERAAMEKKVNLPHENKHPDMIAKDLRSRRHPQSVADKIIKRKRDLNIKRKECLSFTSNNEYKEQPCLKNQDGFSSLASQDCHGKKNRLVLSNCDAQSRKDGPSVCKCRSTDSSIGTGMHACSWTSKKMSSTRPSGNADSCFISSRISRDGTVSSKGEKCRSPKKALDHASLLGGTKLTSFWKNDLSINQSPHSQLNRSAKKSLDHKRPGMHWVWRSNDEAAVTSVPAVHGHDYQVEAPVVIKNLKGRAGSVSTGKESDMVSNGSGPPRECDNHEVEKIGTVGAGAASNVLDPVKEVGNQDGFVCEPISKLSGGDSCMKFDNSSDSGSPGIAGLSNLKMESRDYVTTYQEHCLHDLGQRENNCAEKVSKSDASEAQGSYCLDVDPIPIPGPPGSFLPSPGHMGSEHQGNSSLTTCRILSSEDDEHELVDMDTSDSPVSATSFASNSVAGRSDSVSYANIAAQSQGGVQHNYSQHDVSEERMDPAVESCVPFEQAASENDKVKLEVNKIIRKTSPATTFKNGQPCCSMEEGVVQNGSLNYHHDWEHPMGRQTMTHLPPPPSGGCDQTKKICSSNLRPETNPQEGCADVTAYHSSEAKFPTLSDRGSPSPSASSNSVLRLMGKNLMVVNKEENQNWTPQIVPTQSRTSGYFAFHNAVFQGRDMQTCKVVQYLDFRSSDQGSKFRTPDLYPHRHPSRVFPNSIAADSSAQAKEVIVRKASPDKGGLAVSKGANNKMINHKELAGRSPSVHISKSRALGYDDSGQANDPFFNYQYQTRCFPLHGGSQMVTWHHKPGGLSPVHPDSAPATGDLRSSLYVSSPNFHFS